jgi:hypothetical protein
MFIRKKKNPSSVIIVQIIDKGTGKYHVDRTVGSSSAISEIAKLYQQGRKWLSAYLEIAIF